MRELNRAELEWVTGAEKIPVPRPKPKPPKMIVRCPGMSDFRVCLRKMCRTWSSQTLSLKSVIAGTWRQ